MLWIQAELFLTFGSHLMAPPQQLSFSWVSGEEGQRGRTGAQRRHNWQGRGPACTISPSSYHSEWDQSVFLFSIWLTSEVVLSQAVMGGGNMHDPPPRLLNKEINTGKGIKSPFTPCCCALLLEGYFLPAGLWWRKSAQLRKSAKGNWAQQTD